MFTLRCITAIRFAQFLVAFVITMLSYPVAAQPRYTIQDLGDLGSGLSIPYALNNRGQVVGTSYTGTEMHAFLWERNVMRDLGTIPGFKRSSAQGINDSGQIVGFVEALDIFTNAFVWQNGVMQITGV
jgi:probable HAF family extracellular repeat protein